MSNFKDQPKILKPKFHKSVPSVFCASAQIVCTKFRETQRKTIGGVEIWKMIDDTHPYNQTAAVELIRCIGLRWSTVCNFGTSVSPKLATNWWQSRPYRRQSSLSPISLHFQRQSTLYSVQWLTFLSLVSGTCSSFLNVCIRAMLPIVDLRYLQQSQTYNRSLPLSHLNWLHTLTMINTCISQPRHVNNCKDVTRTLSVCVFA